MELLGQLTLVIVLLLVLWAAVSDLLTMEIPNEISLALVGLFLFVAPFSHLGLEAAAWHLGVGALALAITFALFCANVFGGGDAKLAAAVAIWMGPGASLDFALHTALFGGLLALLFVVVRRIPVPASLGRLAWATRLLDPSGGIPYGIAIAAGTAAALPGSTWAMVALP